MPVLRVQTVLYQNPAAQVWRLLWGLAAAADQLRRKRGPVTVAWAIGDCSPQPCLSPDDATSMAEGVGGALDEVTYEFFDANLGSSGGHNRLAAAGASDHLVVLNPDTYPAPTLLCELVGRLEDRSVAIAEARQLPLEHPKDYDPRRGDTSWASTCCLVVRRAVFDQLGGFDHDHFPLYCDDVDFSWRVRLAGHRVVVAPNAVVFHDKRPRAGVKWVASDIEVYHSTLGRLMLATRYGRPDIVDDTIRSVNRHAVPAQLDAAAEFRRRESERSLPAPEPDAARVAQFIEGEYAVHRF